MIATPHAVHVADAHGGRARGRSGDRPGSDGSPSCPWAHHACGRGRLDLVELGRGVEVARPRTTVCRPTDAQGRAGPAAGRQRSLGGLRVRECLGAGGHRVGGRAHRSCGLRTGPETDPGSEDRPKLVEGGILAEANGVRSVLTTTEADSRAPIAAVGAAPPPPTPSGGRVAGGRGSPGRSWPQRGRRLGGEPLGAAADAEQELAHHREVTELEQDHGEQRRPRCRTPGGTSPSQVTSRVPPPSSGLRVHAQVLCGLATTAAGWAPCP